MPFFCFFADSFTQPIHPSVCAVRQAPPFACLYATQTIAALYTTSVQMPPSIQPRLKPAAWAMPQPPGGPAPAQQGVGACWQHNNRTEARTGLLRCGRQGGKSAGQHWLLVLALPTRKLPLGEIVPHGSLHLASSKKSISAIFLN